jgi:hypothetical protein
LGVHDRLVKKRPIREAEDHPALDLSANGGASRARFFEMVIMTGDNFIADQDNPLDLAEQSTARHSRYLQLP